MSVQLKVGKSYVDRVGRVWRCEAVSSATTLSCASRDLNGRMVREFNTVGQYAPENPEERAIGRHVFDLVEEIGAAEPFPPEKIAPNTDPVTQQADEPASEFDLFSTYKEKVDAVFASNPVTRPAHYTGHPSGVECIQITEHMNFCRGNAVKYIWRAGYKGSEIEDLEKAIWYLQREVDRLKKHD